MSTLFISYSTKDRPIAEIFNDKLMEMGYEAPFRDDHPESGIPAGSEWERELYHKLRLCKALIVLVSRNWTESKWCFAELAYAKAMGKEFFPVLIDDSPDVPSVVAERQGVRLSDPQIWQRLGRGLVEADLAPENDFPWPVAGVDECPYPGLASFETHHAGVYFGRDDEILELRERLNQMTSRGKPRLLYVVGASGSGKSSLVKAGLLPRLTRKESSRWCVLPTFRWNELRATGRDWPEQLAVCLREAWSSARVVKPDRETLRERYLVPLLSTEQQKDESEVTAHKAAIAKAAENFINDTKDLLDACQKPDATPLLIIDQFEELLSDPDDHVVTPFLEFLGCVLSSPRSPWRCIATVRTDFLAAIQTRAELIAWKDQTDVYSLPLMKPDRFYDVIRRPAEKVGIAFESDALVDRMVKDTGTNDALPLLAFTLRELYKQYGDDKQFTFDEYGTKLGGLEGCLTQVANELLTAPVDSNGIPHEERERKLHLAFSNHLVRINDKDQFVRRTALWSELPEPAQPLLQRFIDRRLITSRLRDEKDPQSERVVEVAHEALFRKWDELADWLDERRELLRWRAAVERDRSAEEDKWAGLTRSQLAIANDWAQGRGEELTADEIKWIRSAKSRVIRRWATLSAGLLVLGIAIIGGCTAEQRRMSAERESEQRRVQGEVESKRAWRGFGAADRLAGFLARESEVDSSQSILFFIRSSASFAKGDAHRASRNAGLAGRALSTLVAHTLPLDGQISGIRHCEDGQHVAMWSHVDRNSTVAIWNWQDGVVKDIWPYDGQVRDVWLDRQCSRFVIVRNDGIFESGEVGSGGQLEQLLPAHPSLLGSWVSPDLTQIVTVGHDGEVRRWTKGQITRSTMPKQDAHYRMHSEVPLVLAIPRDGGDATLWDLREHDRGVILSKVVDAKFDTGDRERFVTWDKGGNVTLHESSRSGEPVVMQHPEVKGARFSSDGDRLVTWSDTDTSGTAIIWNLADQSEVRRLSGVVISGACLFSDDRRIATWLDGETAIKVWDIEGSSSPDEDPLHILKHQKVHKTYRQAFARAEPIDGNRLLTFGSDGLVRVWNLEDETVLLPFETGPYDEITALDWSKSGKYVAASTKNGEILLWNRRGHGALLPIPFGFGSGVQRVLFSGDDAVIAWNADGSGYRWTIETETDPTLVANARGDKEQPIEMDGQRMAVTEKWAITRHGDGVRVFDSRTGRKLKDLQHRGHDGKPTTTNGAALNSDGTHALTWGDDGSVRWWLPQSSPTMLPHPLNEETGVQGAVLSRDGTRAVTRSLDVYCWDANKPEPVVLPHDRAFGPAGNDLPPIGAVFTHSEDHVLTWHWDGFARLWDFATGEQIREFQQEEIFIDGIEIRTAISNDESLLLTASPPYMPTPARLWDVEAGRVIREFDAHGGTFNADTTELSVFEKKGVRVVPLRATTDPDAIDRDLAEFEVRSATVLTEAGQFRVLRHKEWAERQQKLKRQ